MNERIKELWKQSQTRQEVETFTEGVFHTRVTDNYEKFAELLLKECVDACWRANKISYSVPPTQQQVALDCAREIETALRS